MERVVIRFKGRISAHGLNKIAKVIVIAENREDAVRGAKKALENMCNSLCEHATFQIIRSKQMDVDAIVGVEKKSKEEISN